MHVKGHNKLQQRHNLGQLSTTNLYEHNSSKSGSSGEFKAAVL